MKGFTKYWLPVILVATLIFIGSSIQEPPVSLKIPHLDKGIHLAEYAVLGFLLKRAFIRGRINQTLRLSLWAIVGAILYGAADEFHQSFVPNREISGLDLLFDSLGAIFGTTLHFMLKQESIKLRKLRSFLVDRKRLFKYNQ